MTNQKGLKIYYWLPFISKVGTVEAVINSAISLQKYSKGKYQIVIINAVGEWTDYLKIFEEQNIEVITLRNSHVFKKLPRFGFIFSRITYLFIFFSSFFKLKKLLEKNPPDLFVAHLITSLPLILNYFFSFKMKLVLKTSGLPKFNYIRKYLWKISLKKVYFITAATKATIHHLKKNKVANENKMFVLNDAMINCKKILNLKKEKIQDEELPKDNFILGVGRLTKQKNFTFLVNSFIEILKKYNNLKLIIVGEGEDRKILEKIIKKNNLENKILLPGYQKNVFKFLKNCKCFVSSSLWEDPGFVSIEAGYCNKPVISSDCDNGPREIILDGKAGFLFKSNDQEDFLNTFHNFMNSKKNEIYKKSVFLKRQSKLFTKFSHYNEFRKILNLVEIKS